MLLPKTMKAAMLYGVRDLRVEDVEIPEVGYGEVLVKIKAATTCGTDLKIYRRGYVPGVISYPTVFGHEWAGVIVKVGEGVENFKPGMRVRAGNSAPCMSCSMCKEGKYNLCENRVWLWGAYAEYIKVPREIVWLNMQEIPSHLSFEEAAITEPLACVIHGASKAGIKIGDVVAIIGAGPIGILHLQVAKRMGAAETIIIDLVEERLEMAEKFGADHTVNARKENVIETVRKLTNGLGADVVVEAVGLPQTWMQALKMVKRGGTVLEFGGCPPDTKIEIETQRIHYDEITLLGTFHATPTEFNTALKMIASGAIDAKNMITRRMKLEDIMEAFNILEKSKRELKIAIIP